MMSTTFEVYADKKVRNYSTRPKLDVEILDDTRECGAPFRQGTCDIHIQYNFNSGKWEHDPSEIECEGHEPEPGRDHEFGVEVFCDGSCRPETKHTPTPKLMCTYCHSQDPSEVKSVMHAWYDAVECSRCGGVEGWALGD